MEYVGLCLTCKVYVRTTPGGRIDGPLVDRDGHQHSHPGEWIVSWDQPDPYAPHFRLWRTLRRRVTL